MPGVVLSVRIVLFLFLFLQREWYMYEQHGTSLIQGTPHITYGL
jgi:hypothetical protein